MRNRRNTRRGRAKRWAGPTPMGTPLRGFGRSVWVWRHEGSGVRRWVVIAFNYRKDVARRFYFASRTAARIAAEHLARLL